MYASQFSDSADWENSFGGRLVGREKIEERIAGVYSLFQQADFKPAKIRIKFITPIIAVADVDRLITGQKNEKGDTLPDRKVRETKVLKKEDGQWKVFLLRAADLRTWTAE